MNITELKSEGLKKEYKVTVSSQEFEIKIDEKIAKVAKTIKLAGFRIGKAPVSMVSKQYRPSVMGEVLDELVNESANEVIVKNKLRPAIQPDIKITSFKEGENIEFDVVIESLPEIKCGDLKAIKLEKLMAEVPAEEVEKALKYLASARKESVKIEEDRATVNGDTVVIDFVGSVDGVEFQGGKGSDYALELGSNSFIPGFEAQLVGKKVGEKVNVDVTFPDTYHAKDLAGKPSIFAVEIKELRANKDVEINEEFAKSLGEESLDKLKEVISNRIKGDYENASRMKIKRTLLDNLENSHTFEVPASLVDAEFAGIKEQYEQAKKMNQLDEHEKSKTEEELMTEYQVVAQRRVKLGLLLSEIGQEAKITVNPEDVNAAIAKEAQRYPGQEKMVFDYYLKNKQAIEALKAPIFEEKIIDHILAQATITEKTISIEELYNFDDEKKETKKVAKKTTKKAAE